MKVAQKGNLLISEIEERLVISTNDKPRSFKKRLTVLLIESPDLYVCNKSRYPSLFISDQDDPNELETESGKLTDFVTSSKSKKPLLL